jgi:hypothetical protein
VTLAERIFDLAMWWSALIAGLAFAWSVIVDSYPDDTPEAFEPPTTVGGSGGSNHDNTTRGRVA